MRHDTIKVRAGDAVGISDGLIATLRSTSPVGYLQNGQWNPDSACAAVKKRLPYQAQLDAAVEVRTWPSYRRTPLIAMRGLARAAQVGCVWLKDESKRFGLGSFKALGGSYAVTQLARRHVPQSIGAVSPTGVQTFACATDGNHGRAVAWGARRAGCHSVVYLHAGVSAGREAALRALGAQIVRVAGTYDESVRQAARDAAQHGWTLVADTANDDRDPAPRLVMAGYTIVVGEIAAQLGQHPPPTHVFVQAGVGGLAAAIVAGAYQHWPGAVPRVVIVEPLRADCVFRSLEARSRISTRCELDTVMAGLACGEVSCQAWPILQSGISDAMAIPDSCVAPAMRLLFRGAGEGDPKVMSGESGVAGIAALLATMNDPRARRQLALGSDSRVLAINTEGATDPSIFESLVPEARGPLRT